MYFGYPCPEPLLTDLDVHLLFSMNRLHTRWVRSLLVLTQTPWLPGRGGCGMNGSSVVGFPAAALAFTFVPCSFPSVTFPLDLTKTRLQVQGEAAVHRNGAAATGQAVAYRGMLRTAAGIVQEEGVRKLWQGATPAVYRHIGDYLLTVGKFVSCFLWPTACWSELALSACTLNISVRTSSVYPAIPLQNKWDSGSMSSLPSLARSFTALFWLLISLPSLQEGLQLKQAFRGLRTINNCYLREVGMGWEKKIRLQALG